jgi:hypothetical protein
MSITVLVKSSPFQHVGRDAANAAVAGARSVARFAQRLLLAMHESRFEQAQRHIQNLQYLFPATKELTNRHSRLR